MRAFDSNQLTARGKRLDLTNDQRHRLKKLLAVVEEMKKKIIRLSKTKNPHGLRIIKVTGNGSYSRGTALRNGSDADVIILMYHPKMAESPPKVSGVLGTVFESVPEVYSPLRKKRAITIREPSVGSDGVRMQVDIVPMMTNKKNGQTPWWYCIDPRGIHRKWVMTSPHGQQEMIGNLKRRAGTKREQRDDPTALIRVLKDWRGTFEADKISCPLPSYVLEVLAWLDYHKHPKTESMLVNRFNRVLISLEKAATSGIDLSRIVGLAHKPPKGNVASGSPLLHDPACLSTNLLQHMTRSDLMWWANEARKDSVNSRTYEEVFPKEVA
jgi:hypothetical protein